MADMAHYLTVAEVAAALGVSTGRVRQLLGQGRIYGARKLGRDWMIPAPVRVKTWTVPESHAIKPDTPE